MINNHEIFNKQSLLFIFQDFEKSIHKPNHKIFAYTSRGIDYITPQELKELKAKKLKISEVFAKTREIFDTLERSEETELYQKSLKALLEKRAAKFRDLNFICRLIHWIFFHYKEVGQHLDKNWNEMREKSSALRQSEEDLRYKEQQEIKRQQEEQRKQEIRNQQKETLQFLTDNLLSPTLDPAKYDLAELGSCHSDDLYEASKLVLNHEFVDEENRTTATLFIEKACEKLIEDRKVQEAIFLRNQIRNKFQPCAKFNAIHKTVQEKQHPLLGYHFSSASSITLKNNVLYCQMRLNQEGKSYFYLEGKLTHHARAKLAIFLAHNNLQEHLQSFFESKDVSVSKGTFKYFCHKDDKFYSFFDLKENEKKYSDKYVDVSFSSYNILLDKIAYIQIGNDKKDYCLYNQFSIELHHEMNENIEKTLFAIFSFFGLSDCAQAQRSCDEERKKILQIFRLLVTNQTWHMERDKQTFERPLSVLKAKVFQQDASFHYAQKFQDIFEKALSENNLYCQPIYSENSQWALQGFAKNLSEKGVVGLMTGVGSLGLSKDKYAIERFKPFESSAEDVLNMLKWGLLSSHDRFQLGILKRGISTYADLESGGGDSVFTRFVMRSQLKSIPVDGYSFSGSIQVLISAKVLERGGYGNTYDNYGAKQSFNGGGMISYLTPESYRSNLLSTANKLNEVGSCEFTHNEVCIKHRIPPEYVVGLHVATFEQKKELMTLLKKEGLVDEKQMIHGKKIKDFIHVGKYFKEDAWSLI